MNENLRALHVTQEPVAETLAGVCPRDESWHVCDHEAPFVI